MREEIEISREVRKYFDEVKKEYDAMRPGPDDFTIRIFQKELGISAQAAKTELDRRVKNGELTVRDGFDAGGKSCKLYRMMVK